MSSDSTPIPDGFKCCPKCGEIKPANNQYFHNDKSKKDGLSAYCKRCAIRKAGQWQKDNPERRKLNVDRYNQNNADAIREYQRLWARAHSEQRKATYQARKEIHSARRKTIYWANPEKARKASRNYYYAHWEKNKQKAREHYRLHRREIIRQHAIAKYCARRQARKQSLPNTFALEDWLTALAYFNHRCAVCGKPCGLWHTIAADHWIPLSNPVCPGTVPENIIPLCHGIDGCNNSKHDRLPDQWLIWRYGEKEGRRILGRIQAYFDWLKSTRERQP